MSGKGKFVSIFLSALVIHTAAVFQHAFSQITSPGADGIIQTQYSGGPEVQDTIFIFCHLSGSDNIGSLTAFPLSGPPGWDFEWSKLDTVSTGYIPFYTQNGVASSTVNNLASGGYRVRITDGNAVETLLFAWVYVRKIEVSAGLLNLTCSQLAFQGTINADRFTYFNPADHSRIHLDIPVSFEWSTSPYYYIPPQWRTTRLLIVMGIEDNPPSVDTRFILTVTDTVGCSRQADFFLETIFPKADFDIVTELDKLNRPSAPLNVQFVNTSENAVEYRWDFGDGTDTVSRDLALPARHKYYYFAPPDYKTSDFTVKLTAVSEEGCTDVDSMSFTVAPSDIRIQNVFTPNGDGANDRFYVDHVSLRFLHVMVFNRNGQKVYDFLGNESSLPGWQGWDGKILNTRQDASPGVYYYVITAYGWDDKSYRGKEYRGTVYLFREK